ncbi:MAG TPA: ABC transporter permease [Pirellulaceae bacterium]|nr:ABC transporter permease [Pirellulaceae bacterium]
MNWQHLTLILWLRWRLSYNQWRRAGKVNAVLTVALVVGALVSAVLAFFVALIVGCLTLSKAEPDHMMFMWDLIILSFLFLWSMGVVTELQRSEFLSLDKMLHFPISPTGAFLLNYLSSLVSFAIILFLPTMIGLSIASVVTHGPAMLLLFPLVVGFVLLVSAPTYQFRGWMATLMRDKRRRRTIITVVTAAFILMTQLPNLANLAFQRNRMQTRNRTENTAKTELAQKLSAGEIDPVEHGRRLKELEEQNAGDKKQEKTRRVRAIVDNIAMVNLVIPVGWLPYGARAAAAGNPWPGLLGSLGMTLLGMVSLWRSYRATMQVYTGQVKATKPRQVTKKDSPKILAAPFLEKTVWGCSEQVSVVVYAGLRNMLRAPEAKMALMTPIIMVVIFGSMIFLGPGRNMPEDGYPFLAVSAIAMTLFGVMQLMINVFGNERGGFRAFVLMPVARRDILLGKNLVIAPLAAMMALVVVVVIQIVLPMRIMHFLATLIQFVPAYLLICLVGNMTSMFAPMPVSAGSLKPIQPKFVPMMVHMFAIMMMPLVLLPAVGALVIELLLDKFAGGRWFPLYLITSAVEFPLAVIFYRFLLNKQGHLLQHREAKILEVVSSNVE